MTNGSGNGIVILLLNRCEINKIAFPNNIVCILYLFTTILMRNAYILAYLFLVRYFFTFISYVSQIFHLPGLVAAMLIEIETTYIVLAKT